MTEILELNGKTYLPASQAARKIGVTRDYVGRLCREGKIVGRRVGPTWYVEAGSLDELLVSQQYVKAKRAQELSGKRVVEYRAHQADVLAPEVSEESAANSLVRTPGAVVPPVVSEVVANVPRHILETQQNVAESLRAAGRRVGASPSARAFLEHAPRAVYPTVHAVAQYSNLAHRLFALAFAFAFTFGAYGFVDAQYRTVAIDTAHQGVLALSALPEYARHVAMDSEAAARDLLALRPSKDEMLASAASVATLTNTGVQYLQGIWNRAITDTASLTRSLIALLPKRDPNGDARVVAEIVASKPKVAALTEQRSGATTVVNHPVVERIREIQTTVEKTVGGISAQVLADSLQQLDNKLSSQIANVTASGNATYQVVAQTNRIDQLSGTDLTNITVHGVSGLAASDIPALSYFVATSTISIAYGGTGTSTAPTYGKMLVGNSVGGYDLLATSTLGVTSSQWTTSGSDIYYTTGNTGIGTTTPTYKLSVEGISSLGNQAIAGYFTATSSNTSSFAGGLTAYASSTIGAGTQTTGLTISGGATTTGNAYFAGNVGIGTASPAYNLQLASPAGATDFAGFTASTGSGKLAFRETSSNTVYLRGFNGSGTETLNIHTSGISYLNGGNIGVGTTTPTGLLHVVSGTSNTATGVQINPTGSTNRTLVINGVSLNSYSTNAPTLPGQTNQLTLQDTQTSGALGVGTTSPFAKFSVHAMAGQTFTTLFAVASSTASATTTLFAITNAGNVGIGTTSPSTALSIVPSSSGGIKIDGSTASSIAPQVHLNLSSTVYGVFSVAAAADGGLTGSAVGDVILKNNQNNDLLFGTTNAERMRITSVGNVGIGTTTPNDFFTINTANPVLNIQNTSSTGSSTLRFGHLQGGSDLSIAEIGTALQSGAAASRSGSLVFYTRNSSAVLNETMRINSAGNIGIGTTTPSARLDVNTSNSNYAAVFKAQNAGAVGIGNYPTAGYGFISGYTNDSLTAVSNLLLNPDGGNVGVGTTSPWGLLSVNPTSAMGTAPSFVIGSSTATKFIVDNTGNVGIGTETPTSILSLYQAATTTLSLTNSQFKTTIIGQGTNVDFFGGGNTTEQQFPLARISALNQYNGSGSYRADLAFLTQSSNAAPVEAMRITSAGNVGIGTTTPDARLDVSASASTQANGLYTTAIFRADSVNSGFLTIESGANSSAVESRYSALQAHSNYLSNGYTAYRNLVLNASGGNVGIGTTTPAQKLDVMGSIYSRDQSNDALIYMDAKSGNYGRIQAANNADTVVKNLALQPSGGNVGIGSASPNSLLSVGGGDYFQVDTTGIIYQNVSSATYDVWIQGSAPGTASGDTRNLALIGNATGDDLILNFNTEYDCVSVGGTSCAYALDVAGAGNFTGDVNVATTNTDPAGNNVVGVHLDSLGYISANRSAGVAGYFGRTADGAIVGFTSAGTVEGYISISGATVSYGAFTGSHYALLSGDASRGELMTLTGDNKNYHNDPESEVLYGIERSTKENDPQILGAYLALLEPTDPRSVENPDQVMAVGNGDMWVVDRGEDLQPGDYLVSSAVPGHAEKDPEADPVSYIIARVAEPVQWGSATSTINGVKHKKVSVFFENFTRSNGVDLASLIASSTASTTPVSDALIDQFFTNVFARVTTWLADATNGVGSVFAQAFHAKQEICVDDQCLTKDDVHALLQLAHGQVAAAAGNSGSSGQVVGGSGGQATTTDPTADTTPPTITLTGASSITIAIGDTYSDLGATVTDNVNNNLGYTISLDGATSTTPDQLSLDTTTAGTHTILFSATDQAGNTGTATRTVIVGDESPVNSEQQTDNSGGNTATTTPPVSDATATSTDTSTSSGPVIVPDSDGTTTPATS